jgi:hypothetical protein
MFLLLCTVTFTSLAQEYPELVTDRPDQTESSVTIPRGTLQLETGWTHAVEEEGGEETITDAFPGTLLRYGVIEGLELRFATEGRVWEELHEPGGNRHSDAGWSDLQVGLKKYLWEEDGCLPEAAILGHLSIPVGEEGFSSGRFDPDFRLSFAHTLTDRLSFGYNLGTSWETIEDDRGDRDTHSSFIYTAALGFGLTDRLGAFIEFFGDIPINGEGGPANSLDGGFTYLLKDNLQVDCFLGKGLSEDAEDWFVGAGFSYRFPR